MLELARSLGLLLKSGWKPARSIVLCSWDGEELGLLGSTNFGESHAHELTKNVRFVLIMTKVLNDSVGDCVFECRQCGFWIYSGN
jgi:Zn-dependent M28 family amino/carboxypeptidase